MLLTPRTIGALVAALRRKDTAATVFAIESKSAWSGEDQINVDGRQARVCEVRSALRLREVLHEDRGGADLVILTDLDARTFGRENLARVALRRIEPVQPWPVVRTLFGVASIDPRLVRHAWMAERLLQAPMGDRTIAGGTLDLETAWGIMLGGFGLRSARPSEDEFLDAAAKPVFAQAFQTLPTEGREEFKRVIQESLDRLGATVLSVVERGLGEHVLAAGLVAQCLFEVHDADALSIRGAFGERFGVRGIDGVVASRWGSAVRKLISRPEATALASRVRAQADALLVGDLGGAALAHASSDLPSGLTQRVRLVAECVERALVDQPSEQDLAELRDAVKRVENHALAGAHGDADRAVMAARLVRWIAEPRTEPVGLEAAVRRYAESECWVDRARIIVRDGESVPEARRAYQVLAQRVAQERAKLNTAVAPAAIAASLPAGGLIGVEHVLEKVVAPLAAVRPVALIVMDGMSHAVALDLVRALEKVAWVRYRPKSLPAAPLVLSTVPTVTEFARTSLLCGALRAGDQADEREGFSAFLKAKSLGSSSAPTVFHKDKLDDESSKVEEAIRSTVKVVACVVNAIDAQLDGSDQLRAQWNLRTIPVLGRLVRACELAGRAIVLTSDHGHLVDEATEQLPANGVGTLLAAARWRGADGALRPGELDARGPRVLVSSGACVVAADERVRYGKRHAGYHGGVTVQELACPLHVLVHTGNDAELADWVPIESEDPSWWQIDGSSASTTRPAPVAPRPRVRPTLNPIAAGGLFPQGGESWIDALFSSAVYADQRSIAGRAPLPDDQARRIMEVFVQHAPPGGTLIKMTEQALAARLERSVSDTRKLVTLLRNLLNVDGYEVLGQPDRDSLELDVALLKTQFALGGGVA
jgi:hypothetical protein